MRQTASNLFAAFLLVSVGGCGTVSMYKEDPRAFLKVSPEDRPCSGGNWMVIENLHPARAIKYTVRTTYTNDRETTEREGRGVALAGEKKELVCDDRWQTWKLRSAEVSAAAFR